MGSSQRRERERADVRLRILDAAREMFVKEGVEATTMRAIAQRIEYTPTAIYHHFLNKEALLTELCVSDFRTLGRIFQRIGRVGDPLERLARIGEAYVEFALNNPMQYRFMFMTPRPPVAAAAHEQTMSTDPGEDAYDFLRASCAEAIAAGSLRPEFSDPDEVAQMLWSAVHGVVSLHITGGHEGVNWCDARQTARRACVTLVRGLLRSPGA